MDCLFCVNDGEAEPDPTADAASKPDSTADAAPEPDSTADAPPALEPDSTADAPPAPEPDSTADAPPAPGAAADAAPVVPDAAVDAAPAPDSTADAAPAPDAAAAAADVAITVEPGPDAPETERKSYTQRMKEKAAKTKAEMTAKVRIEDPFVDRLFQGCAVWSQSWKHDLWLWLKTDHVLLSSFLVHPDHPFSRKERRRGMVLTIMFALGLCFIVEALSDTRTTTFWVNFLIISWIQTYFDRFYRTSTECGCVQQGVCACCKCFCEKLGKFAVMIQCLLATWIFIFGTVLIAPPVENHHDDDEMDDAAKDFDGDAGGALWKFCAGKFEDFFFMSIASSCFAFAMARRKQMKPADPAKQQKWNSPSKGCCCGCCCASKKPASEMWAAWVGLAKNFEDLPPLPPTYRTFKLVDKDGKPLKIAAKHGGADEIRTYMDVYGCDMREGDPSTREDV